MVVSQSNILVVDTDPRSGESVKALLVEAGFRVSMAASSSGALRALERDPFDLVIADSESRDSDGTPLLTRIRERTPELPVVLLASRPRIQDAVDAMRLGAADFVEKPPERDALATVVQRTLELSARDRDAVPDFAPGNRVLLGESPAIAEVHSVIRRAAPTLSTVLIRGESGTGKELVARAVHAQSKRASGPFVRLNCAALPDSLLESELFGYEKGAFTGASARKPGRVELAEGGTLFLDEIGDITPALQSKLLRLLQDREYDRLGGTQTLRADVRFVAATSRPLERMVKNDKFRADLLFRLNVVPIRLPPLRERPEDIERLAHHFCAEVARVNDFSGTRLDKAALGVLRQQRWRGNVRELQNFVERVVVLSDGPVIGATDVQRELAREPAISSAAQPAKLGTTLEERLRAAERDALLNALNRAGDNRSLAARLLGISRRTLYTKMHEHGLE